MEFTYKTLRCKEELLMTRFMVLQLSATHWFDISAAKRDFGYQPRISLQEGLKRLKQSFST
jgi:nucleoside-diphosphate-sugar epimerase